MPELRDTNYYADKVAARYPNLDPKVVRRICRYLMRKIGSLTMDREEVLLYSARYAVKLKIFLADYDIERHNQQNAQGARARVYQRDQLTYFNGSGPRSRPPGHRGLKSIR